MSTRGTLIELKKDKCRVGFIHYGLDYLTKLIENFYEPLTDGDIEQIMQEAKEKWNIYQEFTDRQTIERFYRHDTDAIEMDADIFIFIEDKGHYKDFTVKWSA